MWCSLCRAGLPPPPVCSGCDNHGIVEALWPQATVFLGISAMLAQRGVGGNGPPHWCLVLAFLMLIGLDRDLHKGLRVDMTL